MGGVVEKRRNAEQRELAEYTHALLTELHRLTKNQNLEFLAYLIEMAKIEAGETARAGLGSVNHRRERDGAA